MSTTSHYVFEVPTPGADIVDDDWERTIPAHIEALQAAPSLLNHRTIDFDKRRATFTLEWSQLIRSYQRHFSVMREIEAFRQRPRGEKAYVDVLHKFPRKRPRITIELTLSGRKSKDEGPHGYSAAVESFLHDVFLIMNIAAPGSCNFYLASLRSKDEKHRKQLAEVSLSQFNFELALRNRRDGKWPAPKMLDVRQVVDWVFAVRRGVTQVPQSRMEKVLFALLHIAKTDVSPVVVVWLFYALETLFDTRPGENRRALLERAKLLLSPNERDAAVLGKNLRGLYEYRSKLVHGGLEIIHPMHHEGLDRRVWEKYLELAKVAEFGFALVLVSVQAIIEKGWREPRFAEVLSGECVEPSKLAT